MTKEGKLAVRQDVRLSWPEAERVLHRSVELHQARSGKDRLSLAEVQQMAEELGVEPALVHTAYREVRTRELATRRSSRGLLDRVLGDRRVALARTVEGLGVDAVRAQIETYMTSEGFRKKRDMGQRTIWQAEAGLTRTLKRAVDFSGEERLPSTATYEFEVTASPHAPEAETDVVVVADFEGARGQAALASGLGGSLAAGLGVGLGLLLSPWVLPVGAALALGVVGLSRSGYRSDVESTVEILEHVLDRLQTKQLGPAAAASRP